MKIKRLYSVNFLPSRSVRGSHQPESEVRVISLHVTARFQINQRGENLKRGAVGEMLIGKSPRTFDSLLPVSTFMPSLENLRVSAQ